MALFKKKNPENHKYTYKNYIHQPRNFQHTNKKPTVWRGLCIFPLPYPPVVQHILLTEEKTAKISPHPQPASRAVLTTRRHCFISAMFNNHQFYGNNTEKAWENENRITNLLFVCISAGQHHPENDAVYNTKLSPLFQAARGCHHWVGATSGRKEHSATKLGPLLAESYCLLPAKLFLLKISLSFPSFCSSSYPSPPFGK